MDILSFAIGKASGGGSPTPTPIDLIDLVATENGTYTHSGHDGYDEVTVNVANSYSASDEGKVVSSGALVSQTSTTKNANGTYDTTTNNEVVVNVPNSYTAGDEGKVVSSGALVGQTSTTKTTNGTYDTTTNNEVVVNVENSYAAADEGKVVQSGALVSQTSATKTSNGTYDTTTNNEIVVNVPSTPAPTGTKSITANGTGIDVAAYAYADVAVPTTAPEDYVSYTYGTSSSTVNYVVSAYVNSNTFSFNDIQVSKGLDYGDTPFSKLNTVTFNTNKVTRIPAAAFYYCTPELTNINLHEGITRIHDKAFYSCAAIGRYWTELPSTLTYIGPSAFYGCTSLYLTSLPDGVTNISPSAFAGCTSIELTRVPRSIGAGAFSGCSKLTTITIPAVSQTQLQANAFYNCKGLTTVTFEGSGLPNTINSTAFYNCTNLTDIYVPWSEGAVANAPWGATNATIHYDYTPTP